MMKKIFSLTWILAMTTSVFAQFTYQIEPINRLGLEITGIEAGTTLSDVVQIPQTAEFEGATYNVVSIGDSALSTCHYVTEFVLPSTLTRINKFAFTNCSDLTHITIPASVTQIGYNPFKSCSSLTRIDVEEGSPSFKSIDGVLFSSSSLISYPCGKNDARYTVPEGVIKIGPYAFMDCLKLQSVEFPNETQTVSGFVFTGCTALNSIYFGDGIRMLQFPIFTWDEKDETRSFDVAEVHFSSRESAPFIDGVFNNMSNTRLFIPLGCNNVYESSTQQIASEEDPLPTGWGDENIKKMTVGEAYADEDDNETPLLYNSIKNIETNELVEGKLQVAINLKNPYSGYIQVPEEITVNGESYTVTRIGKEAFYYNENLYSIYLPATINDIDESGLTRIPTLEEIVLNSDNPYFVMEDGILYNSDQTSLLLIPSGKWFDGGTYTTPATVKNIGWGAIYMTKYLTNFTTGAETIEGENFTLCEGLKEVYLTSENLQRFMMSMLTEGATFFFSTNTTPQTESWANYGDCTFVVNEDFYETNKHESPWTSVYRLATRAESASFDDNLLDLDRHDLYVENLSITLNFTHNGPRSACYSFPIPVNILRENGIEVYDLYRPDYYEAVGDGYALKFKQLWSGETPVDDPLILECAEGKTVTISIPNTILPKENSTEQSIGETVEDYDNWDKYPHFTMTMVENGDLTFPTNTADLAGYSEVWALGGGKLGHISATATVLPHRWYVTLPTAAGTSAAKLRLSLDSADDASTTDLNVITEKTTAPALPIYNLNGMRAVPGHLTPGLYVQGGKVFRCEGAKM